MKVSKKAAASLAAGALALGGAGVAYAAFSGGVGSGGGSAATTSTTSKALTTNTQLTSGTIPLNGDAAPIDIKVSNANPYSLTWLHDSVTIASLPTGCPANSYVMGGSDGGAGSVGASTNTGFITSGYSIHFVDLGTTVNQDSCLTGPVVLSSGVS